VFTTGNLILGSLAAVLIGLSKTALPGTGLVATPLIAVFVSGRAIPGTILPVLIAADVFAVSWYHQHARWDLLRPMIVSVTVGFAAGATFFAVVGSSTRPIDIVVGASIVLMAGLQAWRLVRQQQPAAPTPRAAALYGTTGGFTTFVANAAGPVMNTYLVRLGLGKEAMIGTSTWFYFTVNLAKIPVYLVLGEWSSGGRFFTSTSLAFDAALLPALLIGVFGGKKLFHRLPDRGFLIAVLVLSTAGAVKLLLP
jgi:uncharacterized protein